MHRLLEINGANEDDRGREDLFSLYQQYSWSCLYIPNTFFNDFLNGSSSYMSLNRDLSDFFKQEKIMPLLREC